MKKIFLLLLTLLLALTFTSCSNKSKAPTLSSIVLEKPATNTIETANGYAIFADNTYSASKTFVTRGYLSNGSYSNVNATIKAKKSLDDDSNIITLGSNFKFDTNEIYTVWAEYNGLKSKSYEICAYEANSICDAKITDKPIEINKILSDVKESYILNVKYFDESGSIKQNVNAKEIGNLKVMLYNSTTDQALELKYDDSNFTAKGYDLLIVYTDSTSPFVIFKEVDIYDPSSDFNSIAIYNGGYDREHGSLKGLRYAKRYNGTTITTPENKCNPFTDEENTILSTGHYLTISDGTTEKSYGQGETIDYPFAKDKKYVITLKVINDGKELIANKNIYF